MLARAVTSHFKAIRAINNDKLLCISTYMNHSNDQMELLKQKMEQFTKLHEDVNNAFDSLQEKFQMSMDSFSSNLYLYPSYANKFNKTFENIINSSNNLYDSTTDVITTINDEKVTNHAMDEILNKLNKDTSTLKILNERTKLFQDLAVILEESTKKISALSKEYEVYSELNYHLNHDKVHEINKMKPIFPEIEDLQDLKGPIIGIENDNNEDILCVCYDGINQPEISPIWYKYNIKQNIWKWTPFDPFSIEWSIFGHKWISTDSKSIDGEVGGEIFDGSEVAQVNVNIIEYLFDHNPNPTLSHS